MQTTLQPQAVSRISDLVARLLAKRGVTRAVDPAQDLREAGLTSLDMVNLMLAVEGEFDIFIPQDQMTPENFRNVEAVHALVSGLVANR